MLNLNYCYPAFRNICYLCRMKRINILYLIVVALFASCSRTFEDNAYSCMQSYLKGVVADPHFEVVEKETTYNTDSLCVISLKIREINSEGGYELNKYEYTLVRDTSGVYEALRMTPFERSSIKAASKRFAEGLYQYLEKPELTEEAFNADMLWRYAMTFHKDHKVE